MDPILRTGHLGVRNRGTHSLATTSALEPQLPHQTLHGTPRHPYAFAMHLLPDLVSAIDLQILLPDALDLGNQLCIPLGTCRLQRRIPLAGGV